MNNIAIILAAGSGTRMKSSKSKLLLDLLGKTVIERTVEAFSAISQIDEIIIVCRESDLDIYKELFESDKITFAIGGDTRQQSVKNAVETIDGADLIIIHDGARPLIRIEDIEATIQAAREYGAAAVGVNVKDTIKIIDSDGIVKETPDRSTLFAVQTPQIFDFELYKSSLKKATDDNKDFTDDCAVAEYGGNRVKMVCGDYSNIKITTLEDILVAENILLKRGE